MSDDRPRVSEHDRDYFRRLGEWEAENAEIARHEHAARTMNERLAHSWKLTRELGHLAHDPDDPWPANFYQRARELGLLRE
jgi:hypothetical protein